MFGFGGRKLSQTASGNLLTKMGPNIDLCGGKDLKNYFREQITQKTHHWQGHAWARGMVSVHGGKTAVHGSAWINIEIQGESPEWYT